MQKTEPGLQGVGGFACPSTMSENALFCPPKQQAVVVSYAALSLTMNHHIPYIPQAVHPTTPVTIFFNLPKIHKPTCGLVFRTL